MLFKNKLIILIATTVLFTGSLMAGGDVARGAALAENCADCHGENGLGDDDEFPAIAGMDSTSFMKALMDFKSGERVDEYEMMVDAAADLSKQDIADLAAYFKTLPGS